MGNYDGFEKIKRRVPYSTIGIDYSNISSIVKRDGYFEGLLDKKIIEFEGQGINISACLGYFEDMIDRYIETLLNALESEHLNQKNMIKYLFRKRASDKIEFQELLERLECEIISVQEEYNTVKQIYEKFNPLKNGKLVSEGTNASFQKENEDE